MNFKHALDLLQQGKKIHREKWGKGHYWMFDEEGHLVDSNDDSAKLSKYHIIKFNDWGEYKEDDWKLKDQYKDLKDGENTGWCNFVHRTDVEEFIRRVKKEADELDIYLTSNMLDEVLDKYYGEKVK